jgi:hypothetical protein
MESRLSRSPLKARPLRLPAQSVQEAIDNLVWDEAGGYITFALAMTIVASFEWVAVLRGSPRLTAGSPYSQSHLPP